MTRLRSRIVLPLVLFAMICAPLMVRGQASTQPSVVRVAAIGGINDMGFWDALSDRFEKATCIHIETVQTGNKDGAAEVFKKGGIDFILLQSPEAIMNLVAEGYAMNPRPWAQADLVIVGPENDPAQIKGMTDAAAAVRKIVESKSPFLIHGSLGADQIVRSIDQSISNTNETSIVLNDHQRQVLLLAANKKAYTLIARLPFLGGKIKGDGLAMMVSGDAILRRPMMFAIANPEKIAGTHLPEARKLAGFLTSAETQKWIGEFGKGKLDDRSFYVPIDVGVGVSEKGFLSVGGEVPTPLQLTAAQLSQLPQHQITVKGRNGDKIKYSGVLLADLLKQAGVPLGTHKMGSPDLMLSVAVEAADGYRALFSLAELDADFADRSVILADQQNDQPLDEREGPLRLIAPQEEKQGRWVRRVVRLVVVRAE